MIHKTLEQNTKIKKIDTIVVYNFTFESRGITGGFQFSIDLLKLFNSLTPGVH